MRGEGGNRAEELGVGAGDEFFFDTHVFGPAREAFLFDLELVLTWFEVDLLVGDFVLKDPVYVDEGVFGAAVDVEDTGASQNGTVAAELVAFGELDC